MSVVVLSEGPIIVHYVGARYTNMLIDCANRWVDAKGLSTTLDIMEIGKYVIAPNMNGESVSIYIVSSDNGWIRTERKMTLCVTLRIHYPINDNTVVTFTDSIVERIREASAQPTIIENITSAIEQIDNQTTENSQFAMRAACDIRDDIMRCMTETMSSIVTRLDDISDRLVVVSTNQETMHSDQGHAVDDIKTEVCKIGDRFTSFIVDVGIRKIQTKRVITPDDKKTLIDEIKGFDMSSLRTRKL